MSVADLFDCGQNPATINPMRLNKFRKFLYALAKYSGDAQALTSKRKGAVTRRIGRRVAGKLTGKGLGKLFK